MNRDATPAGAFLRKVRHPLAFRLFLLQQLPAAFFSGLRIVSADAGAATVSVPYGWRTRNPFRSTYFACLSMAAEMSTGILAMGAIRSAAAPVSMLVVGIEGSFFKKATGPTFFTCSEGAAMAGIIQKALETGEGQAFTATATGVDAEGNPIATFRITWSFRKKTKKTAA